jgi:hypothetical protein
LVHEAVRQDPIFEKEDGVFIFGRVILFFPPKRSSLSLEIICHAYAGVLNRTTISKSQFPDSVISVWNPGSCPALPGP